MIQQITAYVPKTDVSQPSQPKASENEADSFQSALSKAKVATSSKENATKRSLPVSRKNLRQRQNQVMFWLH